MSQNIKNNPHHTAFTSSKPTMEMPELCRIFSKLTTIKTTERGQQRHPSFFNVNCEHIWDILLVSPLLTFGK